MTPAIVTPAIKIEQRLVGAMPPYHSELSDLLAEHKPRSVLALGSDRHGVLARYADEMGAHVSNLAEGTGLASLENADRHDMAVVFPGSLEIRASCDAGQLINQLRGRGASVVLVFTDVAAGALGKRDLLGFGFEQLARYRDSDNEVGDLRLYRFRGEALPGKRAARGRRSVDDPALWEKYRW
ncbi:MAG: DUF6231 family protein [Gammaproteobacteria bacterium]